MLTFINLILTCINLMMPKLTWGVKTCVKNNKKVLISSFNTCSYRRVRGSLLVTKLTWGVKTCVKNNKKVLISSFNTSSYVLNANSYVYVCVCVRV